jgi:hypothetical protein
MVSMAMHPDNQSIALKNETITVSAAIREEQLAHAHTIMKWDLVTSQNSLSSYSLEPSTYAHFKPKEMSNKKKKDEPTVVVAKETITKMIIGVASIHLQYLVQVTQTEASLRHPTR